MKRKILLSPLIIIVLIILAGVGLAGAAVLLGGGGEAGSVNLQKGYSLNRVHKASPCRSNDMKKQEKNIKQKKNTIYQVDQSGKVEYTEIIITLFNC